MKKKHLQEIKRITDSIPKELLDKLMVKQQQFPTTIEIMQRALHDPLVSEEDKQKFRTVLATGLLEKEVQVLDPEIEKQIDAYLNVEFEKARKLGRLPPPQKMPNIYKKSKHLYSYAKRQKFDKGNDTEEA